MVLINAIYTYQKLPDVMKVFIFVIEGIIIKYHKESMNKNQAKRADKLLVKVFYCWNNMYLYSRQEYFLELELETFKV